MQMMKFVTTISSTFFYDKLLFLYSLYENGRNICAAEVKMR